MKPRMKALALMLGTSLIAVAIHGAEAATATASQQKLQQFDGLWDGPDSMLFNLAPITKAEDPESPTPPLKGEYLAKFEAVAAAMVARNASRPTSSSPPPSGGAPGPCGISSMQRMGASMPMMMAGGMGAPMEFVVASGRLYFVNVGSKALRRIYVDGRSHPGPDDIVVSRVGHSIGHWEGNTLVVDTIGILPGPIDAQTCHSGALHIVERFKFLDKDTLQAEVTLEDSEALTKPWTSTRVYHRSEQTEVVEPDNDAAPVSDRHF